MLPKTPARQSGYVINPELENYDIIVQFPIVFGNNEDEYSQKYVKCCNRNGGAFYVYLDDSVYVDSDNLVCFQLGDPKSDVSEFSSKLIKLFHRDISGLVIEISDPDGLTGIEVYTIGNNGNSLCADTYKYKDESGDLEVHYPLFKLSEVLVHPDDISDAVDKYWSYVNSTLSSYAMAGIDAIISDLESTAFSLKAIKKFLISKLNGEPELGSDPCDIYLHNENLLEIFKQIASLSNFSQEIKSKRAMVRATESRVQQFHNNEFIAE